MFIIVNDNFVYRFIHFQMMLHRREQGGKTVKKTDLKKKKNILYTIM